VKVRLGEIAYARSGDKGSSATLGVCAYTREGFEFLREHLTAECVESFFKPMGCAGVKRWELPNLLAFSFVLSDVLAGGGSRSLRVDAQGKAIGQIALEMMIEIPSERFPSCVNPEKREGQS
jgi:hypothetical protein